MITLNGKKEAEEILQNLQGQILKTGASPALSVIFIGDDPASKLFIRTKTEESKKIGIQIHVHQFAAVAQEDEVIEKIKQLNQEKNVHGVIVQLPLPQGFDTKKIIEEIAPEKDVDGFREKTQFQSPLILAILAALIGAADVAQNKEILAIVNSDIFGLTLKRFLRKENLKINYLLSDNIADQKDIIRAADVIITALGKPKFLKGDMVKEGVVLIDAGIVVSESGKVIGDVDKESVAQKAAFLTPVPGGIGPLTVAYLLKNVFLSYELLSHYRS